MQILVTKPGVLNQRDRLRLRRAGVVTVEADNPADVKLIQPGGEELSGGGMMLAALRAMSLADLTNPSQVRYAFVEQMLAEMERERAPTPQESES